ncbi:alpha/beta fold hydrolase [Maritalea sp.]|uniref:alpha/beta fold hydrolase n=1 Tax=Maritalea sp. TaxID=2003361 RepID=UPI003EF19EC8
MPDLTRKFVEHGNHKFGYFDVGAPDAPTLLLCHGLAANAEQFDADIVFFAENGFRVIAPDLRGHSHSHFTKTVDEIDWSICAMAHDIIAILDHAKVEQVAFVGNSLGGLLGLKLMEEHRHRLSCFASFGTTYSLQTPKLAIWLLPKVYKLLGKKLVAIIGAKGASKAPKTQAKIQQMFAACDLDAVTSIAAQIGNYDLIENALAFEKPILMLRGEHDSSINPKLGPTLNAMQGLPNFKLVEVPGGGHFLNLDARDKVRSELLSFLRAS